MSADAAMIRFKRPVDGGCSNLEHQMGTTWRPAHLLVPSHPAMQQPLHGTFSRRGREPLVIQLR